MTDQENRRGFFASRANLVLLGFLAIGGFYLTAEHWAHLLGAAPLLLLLLLCVGMHLFMHAGHGGHGHGGAVRRNPGEGETPHPHGRSGTEQ